MNINQSLLIVTIFSASALSLFAAQEKKEKMPTSRKSMLYQTAPMGLQRELGATRPKAKKIVETSQKSLMNDTALNLEERDRKILEALISPDIFDPETAEMVHTTADVVNAPITIDSEGHQVTPLALAAIWGWSDMIDALCSKGAHVDDVMPTNTLDAWQGCVPLHIAIVFNRIDAVKKLITLGANFNAKINNTASPLNGRTPLDLAIDRGYEQLILLLNQMDAERTLVPQDEAIGELISTQQQQTQTMQPINAEAIDLEGQTDLIKAIRANDAKAVQDRVAKGSNPNTPIQGLTENPLAGFSPLCFALHLGYNNIALILLQYGADPNYVIANNDAGKNGFSPMHIAIAKDNADMVIKLIEYKADINVPIQDRPRITPLCLSAECGYPEIITILCEFGGHINYTLDGFTPLHHAIINKHPQAIKALIKHKADPNILVQKPHNPYDGFNALCLAILHNDPQGFACLRILLKANGDYNHILNTPLYQGVNPLKLAISIGNVYAIKALVGAGAQVDPSIHAFVEQFKATLSSETYADIKGYLDIAFASQQLLHMCKDFRKSFKELITLQQQDTSTPIEKSASEKVANIEKLFKSIEELLKNGADVNIKNRNGLSPLHMAIYKTNPVKTTISDKLASLLLAYKADPNGITLDGISPINLAITYGNMRLIKELLDKGADPDMQIGPKPLAVAQKANAPKIIKMIEDALQEKLKHPSKFKKLLEKFRK